MGKKRKLLLAFVLGIISFLLLFFVGEGIRIPPTVPAAAAIHAGIGTFIMGAYFFAAAYFLTPHGQKPARQHWPVILALNAVLLVAALITLVVEPNKAAVMLTIGVALLAGACSCAGMVVSARRSSR